MQLGCIGAQQHSDLPSSPSLIPISNESTLFSQLKLPTCSLDQTPLPSLMDIPVVTDNFLGN